MDKKLFKQGAKYRICDSCNEWVPAELSRCDKCHAHISNFDFYTVEEAHEAAAKGKLQCMICNTIVEAGNTLCPECGNASLSPVVDVEFDDEMLNEREADNLGAHDLNQHEQASNVSNMATESYPEENGHSNTQFFNAVEEDDDGSFYFEGEILTGHGRKAHSRNKIIIGQDEIVVGRKYFIETPELFFDGYSSELQERFKVISTENAVISIRDGRVTIRKCRNEASRIRLYRENPDTGRTESAGEIVGTDEHIVRPGDSLDFGNGEDMHRHILLRFGYESARDREELGAEKYPDKMKALDEKIDRILEGNSNMEKRMSLVEASITSVEQLISSINFADLAAKKDETMGEYDERLANQVPEAEELEIEKVIKNFLMIPMESGNIKDCSHQYEVIKDRQQIVEYLWQAAFYEKVCNMQSEKKPDTDYSAVINCIGRAFEEFICTYLLKMIYASQGDDFEKEMRKNGVKLDSIPQGRICNYLTYFDWINNQKVHRRANRVVVAAGYGADNSRRQEFFKAVENAKLATKDRNEGSHASAAKHTSKEDAEKYMALNSIKYISKEEYMKMKRTIFGEKTLSVLMRYYDKVCTSENK